MDPSNKTYIILVTITWTNTACFGEIIKKIVDFFLTVWIFWNHQGKSVWEYETYFCGYTSILQLPNFSDK